MTPLAAAALRYAERGFVLLPLHTAPNGRCTCGEPTCNSRGKHPRTQHGLEDATSDPRIVGELWTRWPDANIGCRPGPSGYLVIDIDGPDGEAAAQRFGLLSEPTLEVETGREDGGRHRWYKHPGGHVSNAPLAPNLDVRADAGYVLVPPSVHSSGRVYLWRGRLSDVTDLPDTVLARLRGSGTTPPRKLLGETIPEGVRDQTLTRLAGALRRVGATVNHIRTMLDAINREHVHPPLADSDLDRIALSVGRYAPAGETPAAEIAGPRWGTPAPIRWTA